MFIVDTEQLCIHPRWCWTHLVVNEFNINVSYCGTYHWEMDCPTYRQAKNMVHL